MVAMMWGALALAGEPIEPSSYLAPSPPATEVAGAPAVFQVAPPPLAPTGFEAGTQRDRRARRWRLWGVVGGSAAAIGLGAAAAYGSVQALNSFGDGIYLGGGC